MEVNDSNYLQKLFIDEAKPALEWFETRWGGGEVKLPEGYEKAEYIENILNASGASKTGIDTGIIFNGDIELNLKVYVPKTSTSVSFNMFYAYSNGFDYGINGTSSVIMAKANASKLTSSILRKKGNIYEIKMSAIDGVMKLHVKNVDTGEEDTKEVTYDGSFDSGTSTIHLFGLNTGSSANGYALEGHRVYYAKIVKNGEVVMNYIPATKDGVPGFYDSVSGEFVTHNYIIAG